MNKKIIFLAVFILGFLLSFNSAQAGCCVSNCSVSSEPLCSNGTVPDSRDCKDIDVCKDVIIFPNPIGFATVSELLNSILSSLMGVIVIISVIFIIIGGIMYMTSAGNETMVTRAKKTWTGATVGLAIALASPIFLKQIKEILGNKDAGSADDWVKEAITIREVAVNVLNFLLSIFGIIAIISLVIAGGLYLTAYGDEKKIDTGKKMFRFSIIGIAIALGALVLVRQIASLLER